MNLRLESWHSDLSISSYLVKVRNFSVIHNAVRGHRNTEFADLIMTRGVCHSKQSCTHSDTQLPTGVNLAWSSYTTLHSFLLPSDELG